MEAAEAANLMYGARIDVYTIGDEVAARGKVEAFDEHGLALSMPDNAVSKVAYFPWSTVTGVYWLGEDNE